jgi:hypothetical protein
LERQAIVFRKAYTTPIKQAWSDFLMAEVIDVDEKRGTIWQDYELDLIVADYFAMLSKELSRQPYVKSHHSAALMAAIGRSHRSVEFKHQNISAVLDMLGMPWIPGYKPKWNYQNAIFDAIDRHLSHNSRLLELVPQEQVPPPQPDGLFVEAPIVKASEDGTPERLQRLVAKFDPVERDHVNRALGSAGESFVVEVEKRRLIEANRADLARQVRWTAMEDGDGAGYDVSSFFPNGNSLLVEVKTTNGSARTPFFLTRNEFNVATSRAEEWRIYRVHLFATTPKIFTIAPPLESALHLRPDTWRASFR